jgi:hypothetical protein
MHERVEIAATVGQEHVKGHGVIVNCLADRADEAGMTWKLLHMIAV